MTEQPRRNTPSGNDAYKDCAVYLEHGACVCSTGYPSACTAEQVTPDEIEVKGHKVFAHRVGENVVFDAVNDERPLVRMRFLFGPEDVQDVINMLEEARRG